MINLKCEHCGSNLVLYIKNKKYLCLNCNQEVSEKIAGEYIYEIHKEG